MSTFISHPGNKIHYESKGNGNAIVFLHGFTETLHIWDEFSDRLSENFQVVCIDLPGHGQSDNINDVHSMELMADCVAQLLASIHIKKTVVIGHSMGGYVALAFAERYKGMVAGLTLFHSMAFADSAEAHINRMKTNEFIRKNRFNFLCAFIPSLFTEENQEKYKPEIAKLIADSKKMSLHGVVAANSGMAARPDRCHVLKSSTYPVMFIGGKQDIRVPLNKMLEQIALPDDCVALLMGDVAHMGFMEAKEKTFYAVKTFADGCF